MFAARKHRRHMLILILAAALLSGCIGAGYKSVAVRDYEELSNLRMPVGESRRFNLTMEPADAELILTSDNQNIVAVTSDEESLVVEALQIGTASLRVIARKEGYQDTALSFQVEVFDPDAPRINSVRLLPNQHVTGQEQILEIEVETVNIEEGTPVAAELLREDGTSLTPEIRETAPITDSYAALTLTVPAELAGAYWVRVSIEGADPYIAEYHITPVPEDESSVEVYAELASPEYTAGEPLALLISLRQQDKPALDGEYLVTVYREGDEESLEEKTLLFAEGEAEFVLAEPLSEAGEYVLIIAVEGGSCSLAVTALPAPTEPEEEDSETGIPVEPGLHAEAQQLPSEPVELQAALAAAEYVAGKPLVLRIVLSSPDGPLPDGEYPVRVYCESDAGSAEEKLLSFVNGEAEFVFSEPLTKAGIYGLTVEAEGSQSTLKVTVLPGEPADLRLLTFPETGTANVPLGPVMLSLYDAYGNVIAEGGRLIAVSSHNGFVSGSEEAITNEWGVAEFSNLVLHEGEYILSFASEDLETVSPLLTVALQGHGNAESPYLIHNLHGLQRIRDDVSAHYQLGNDIDAGATAEDSAGWQPIENFAGSLSGGESAYAIYALYIDLPGNDRVGLFASISPEGTVSNLTLDGAAVTGKNSVGSLAGTNHGRIVNCSAVNARVQGQGRSIGGLVGDNRGTILDSKAFANVSGGANVGGLAGLNASVIERSSANGLTSASGIASFVGGLVGNNRGRISRSYALGQAQGSPVGGLVGHNQNHGSGVITESYAAVYLVGAGNRGGLTGLNFGTVSKSYFDSQVAGSRFGAGLGKSTQEMKEKDTYAGWDFARIWEITESANDGYPVLRKSN